MNINSYVPRDYDKDPIVIKDYGAYFQLSFIMEPLANFQIRFLI
jgi:hypothetical protein